MNVAWSPPAQHPIMLAAGTAAQQLDASFSTSASLDLYSLNLQQPGYEMELQTSIPSDHRYLQSVDIIKKIIQCVVLTNYMPLIGDLGFTRLFGDPMEIILLE